MFHVRCVGHGFVLFFVNSNSNVQVVAFKKKQRTSNGLPATNGKIGSSRGLLGKPTVTSFPFNFSRPSSGIRE